MSGHQAGFWHAGIGAKWIAAHELGRRARGACAWLVVDQDDNKGGSLAYPRADLSRGVVRFTEHADGVPTGCLPAADTSRVAVPGDAHAVAEPGVRRAIDLMRTHAGAPSLAAQLARAAAAVVEKVAPGMIIVTASDIARTSAMERLVAMMERDPLACARAYNGAASRVPAAHVQALGITASRVELPLWRVRPGAARERVFAAAGGTIDRAGLMPRALLVTALARLFACDLFIHGLGGGVYDVVTDAWLAAWLGPEEVRGAAPAGVVSATRYLEFPDAALVSPRQAERAAWVAHRARHDPALLGDEKAGALKRNLAHRIARAGGRERGALFLEMHALLKNVRERSAAEIAALDDKAERVKAAAALSRGAFDRTWPLVLFGREQLAELDALVRGAL